MSLTEGEFRLSSKDGGTDEEIAEVKRLASRFIDYIRKHGKDPRSTAVACTQIETASMWGVKSVTYLPRQPDEPKSMYEENAKRILSQFPREELRGIGLDLYMGTNAP